MNLLWFSWFLSIFTTESGHFSVPFEVRPLRLSMAMQIDITKQILSLGTANPGFYTPQFQDRAMKLQMFCLGRHWEAGIIKKKILLVNQVGWCFWCLYVQMTMTFGMLLPSRMIIRNDKSLGRSRQLALKCTFGSDLLNLFSLPSTPKLFFGTMMSQSSCYPLLRGRIPACRWNPWIWGHSKS